MAGRLRLGAARGEVAVADGACAQNYVPNVMTGHVVPEIPLQRVKDRLSQVRGALVECPMVRPFLSVCALGHN